MVEFVIEKLLLWWEDILSGVISSQISLLSEIFQVPTDGCFMQPVKQVCQFLEDPQILCKKYEIWYTWLTWWIRLNIRSWI